MRKLSVRLILGTSVVALLAATMVLFAVLTGAQAPRSFATQTASAVAPDGFSLLASDSNGPASWGCVGSIPVGLNTGSLPPLAAESLRRDLLLAFDSIAAVSDFRFVLAGDTDEVPDSNWGEEWPSRAPSMPVVVAVVPESASDLAFSGAAASGGGFLRSSTGSLRISAGFVLLHDEHFADYRPGSGFMSHSSLLIHELLHVLNVGHNDASDSIMTPSLADSYGTIGAQDIAALDLLSKYAC